jgi:hypothetical protein
MAKEECAICEKERYLVTCSRCTLDQDRRASRNGGAADRAEKSLVTANEKIGRLQECVRSLLSYNYTTEKVPRTLIQLCKKELGDGE